jgi:hypothetical protein
MQFAGASLAMGQQVFVGVCHGHSLPSDGFSKMPCVLPCAQAVEGWPT